MTFSIISACTACLDLQAKSEQTPGIFGAEAKCMAAADFFLGFLGPFLGFFFSLVGAFGEESLKF
jgi:hypothetical protein